MSHRITVAAVAALGVLALAGCNTTKDETAANTTTGSNAAPAGEHNDTVSNGGAVSTGPGTSAVGAPGLSTGASATPPTPTVSNQPTRADSTTPK